MTSADQPLIHALVPAGGVGARAFTALHQLPKQYRLIKSDPMIVWAVKALLAEERVSDVVIGVQSDDVVAATLFENDNRVRVLPSAGVTRALTVLSTLEASGWNSEDWVLVHDAARPGLPKENLSMLIDTCLEQGQGGILALPAADTVKRARQSDPVSIQDTLPREQIWLAQTPQMFRVGQLSDALKNALACNQQITDESSAMELAGQRPLLVQGSVHNSKVTWPDDFEWIQRWL